MNFMTLVEAFSLEELNELQIHIRERQKRLMTNDPNFMPLNELEGKMAASGQMINAIKAYRTRTGRGLFEGKLAYDIFMGRI